MDEVMYQHQRGSARPDALDASLLLQITASFISCGMPALLTWLWGSAIDDLGVGYASTMLTDERERSMAMGICAYFDAVGTMYTHGCIHERMLFDWLDAASVWDRIKGYVLERRRVTGDSTLWSGFETLAVTQKRLAGTYAT